MHVKTAVGCRLVMLENFLIMNSNDVPWRASSFAEKIWVKDLGQADGYALQIVKFESGAKFPAHHHHKAEFMYILEGELIQNNHVLKSGFVSIAQAGTHDESVYTNMGCTFLILSSI